MPKSGTAKSFLGGPEKKKDKHNGVPSPAKGHLVWNNNDQPQWSFGKPSEPKRTSDADGIGPDKYEPKHVSHVSRSAPFSMAAKGGKGPAVDDGTELSAKIRNV